MKRVNELPSTRILKEAFEVGKALYHGGYKSCYSSYRKILSDFNIKDLDDNDFPQIIHNASVEECQLSSVQSMMLISFIYLYSKIYNNFTCQTYLSFDLSEAVTKELSK